MKLIGAGLPRTATLSQRTAIEALGLTPCYHMQNILMDLNQTPRWCAVLDGKLPLEEFFSGFVATVDWPGSYFYRELAEIYPDAKVLLSVRDSDAWARSMHQTIWGLFYDDTLLRHLSDARGHVDQMWALYIETMKDMWQRRGLLNGPETTLEWMRQAFRRYNEEVRRTIPAGRLLVWSAMDGWEPLCEFLELPVPDIPFPRVNDSDHFIGGIVQASMQSLQAQLAISR